MNTQNSRTKPKQKDLAHNKTIAKLKQQQKTNQLPMMILDQPT